MNVQSDILMQLLKEKNMSQAQLAKVSGVTENTISSWKKDEHDAKKSYVERVAKALGTTVKKLTTPPQDDGRKRVAQTAELELVAHYYGVSPNTIVKLAPLLFSVIAKRALKTRLDELEDWYKNLQDAVNLPVGIKPFFDHYKSADDELKHSSFAEIYWEERKRRESRDFSADVFETRQGETVHVNDYTVDRYGCDLFFQELIEIDTSGAMSDYDEHDLNLRTYDEYEPFIWSQTVWDSCWEISAEGKDNINGTQEAFENLFHDDVRVSQIPPELFKKGKEQERVDWINAKGEPAKLERLAAIKKFETPDAIEGGKDA